MTIWLVSPTFPPIACGIGDYTANLARELAGRGARVRVLTARGAPSEPPPGVEVDQPFGLRRLDAGRDLARAVEAGRPDWLFLQYDPYSFGLRYAFDPVLPAAVRRIKARRPGVRVAVMVHESVAPAITWKKALMGRWQRAQLRALGRAADVVFFAIDPWVRRYGPWFPGKPVLHLRIGSNVPRQPDARAATRARLGIGPEAVVLGLFGRLGGTSRGLEAVRRSVAAVEAAGREAAVLYVGLYAADVRAGLASAGARLIDDNPHPAAEVSRRLSAMDVYLLPIAEGLSTRRTTLMAGLEHGVAVVGTRGEATDELLLREDGRSLLLVDADAPDRFGAAVGALVADPERRLALARGGRELFEREFSWPRIAARVEEAFGLRPAAEVAAIGASPR